MIVKTFPILILVAASLLWGCKRDASHRIHLNLPIVAFNDDGEYLNHPVGPGLVAKPDSPIPDVPMPIGFKPVVSQCNSSFDGVSRTVTHVYQGRARAAEAVLFYRQQLPLNDWRFVDKQTYDDGSTGLHYDKGGENLSLRIAQRFKVAIVEVFMTPR